MNFWTYNLSILKLILKTLIVPARKLVAKWKWWDIYWKWRVATILFGFQIIDFGFGTGIKSLPDALTQPGGGGWGSLN